jgi:hypothetical protein
LVVNCINKQWIPCHVIVKISKVHETTKAAMTLQLKDLFTWFDLCDKVIVYVKDKGANLNTLTNTSTNILSYFPLMLPQPYASNCFGHAMSKCY